MKVKEFAKALFVAVVFPLGLLITYLIRSSDRFGTSAAACLLIWMIWMTSRTHYDSKTIEGVRIPYAPSDIVQLLKKTTESGGLINVWLLKAFSKSDSTLSQTQMIEYAKTKGVALSSMQISKYAKKLERQGLLLQLSRNPTRLQYRLNDKGKWCKRAIELCFAERNFPFYVNNGLGLAQYRLNAFPSS
jgi:hypothetical protein